LYCSLDSPPLVPRTAWCDPDSGHKDTIMHVDPFCSWSP